MHAPTTFYLPILVLFWNFVTKFGITNFSYQCGFCTWLFSHIISRIVSMNIFWQIAISWIPQDLTDDCSTLAQVMTWYQTIRQQAINWTNADPDRSGDMELLGHNELTLLVLKPEYPGRTWLLRKAINGWLLFNKKRFQISLYDAFEIGCCSRNAHCDLISLWATFQISVVVNLWTKLWARPGHEK